jgi:hypothetical protein
MHRVLLLLSLAAALLLAACGQLPGRGDDGMPPPGAGMSTADGTAPAADGGAAGAIGDTGEAPADLGVDLRQPPRWRSAEELVTPLPAPQLAGPEGLPSLGEGIAAVPEGDAALRQEVAERCANRPASVTEESLLRGIVADLDADGVDPGLAVDALIIGRCGDLADIVTEVVARGGESAALPAMERAIALTGGASALIVERAAAEGLLRTGRERVTLQDLGPPALAGAGSEYAMLYFPLGGDAAAEDGAMSLAQLFGNAEPGYGIYTYILGGVEDPRGDADVADGKRLATYRELLRVIETYVLGAGPDGARPDPGAHTFLVPVHAGREGAALLERTGPELSAAMRRELGSYLRRGGQLDLANRLAGSPGPFLVSSLEPRLVPGNPQAARMIVDLSRIGPEYMYSVVDAYDRQIRPEDAGRLESLLAVSGRLMELFPDATAGGSAPPHDDWVFMLGGGTTRAAAGGVSESSVGPPPDPLVAVLDNRR